MNHKRGRPKNRRAGCIMCKRHKVNGFGKSKLEVSKTGFAKLRDRYHAEADLKEIK